ncbi:MAG: DUF1990 family protein [Solirubrobacteraceae bacterium]
MKLTPGTRRRLAVMETRPLNFDPDDVDSADPGPGWNVDDRFQALPTEAPGAPEPEGSFEIATRLIRGYEFADPSLVRAYYDPDAPLQGRTMLLELRALNLIGVFVGVRVNAVYEEDRHHDGRDVHVFGWNYRTLEGHVECGQMDWEVWKWPDTGQVAFHVHAISRPASIANPIIRIGFFVLRGHERGLFLSSTDRRMRELTAAGLGDGNRSARIRDASDEFTARSIKDSGAHDDLAQQVDEPRR